MNFAMEGTRHLTTPGFETAKSMYQPGGAWLPFSGDFTLIQLFWERSRAPHGDHELLAAWGECPEPGEDIAGCPADLNGDGTVGVADLLILLANWS